MDRTTTLEGRVLISELGKGGQADRAIAEQLGWSVSTVRKWRRRHKKRPAPAVVLPLEAGQH